LPKLQRNGTFTVTKLQKIPNLLLSDVFFLANLKCIKTVAGANNAPQPPSRLVRRGQHLYHNIRIAFSASFLPTK